MHHKIIDKFFLNEFIKDNNKGKNDEWIKLINENELQTTIIIIITMNL